MARKQKKVRIKTEKHVKVTIDDIVSFFQMLSTLINAGCPLLHALRMAADQSESEKFTVILRSIANKVASGEQFSTAAGNFPEIFDPRWLQMVKTGELTGQLGTVVQQVNESIQKSRASQDKIASAMMYPIILIVVAVSAVIIMFYKVVPTFAEFFSDSGAKLPMLTEYVIVISNFTKKYIFHCAAVIWLGHTILKRYLKTPDGHRHFYEFLMGLPLVGELMVQSAMEKFASNMSLLLKSGTPLMEAIKSTQEIFVREPIYYEAMIAIHSGISRGNNLATSMDQTRLFTPLAVSMARIGEESGKLSEVLDEVSRYYHDRVDSLITKLTGVIEPAIVVFMGVFVATMLAAIYIPMFSMASGGG